METWQEISEESLDCHMEVTNEYMINTQRPVTCRLLTGGTVK